MYIRSVRLTDIVRHERLSRQLLRLNQPDASIIGSSPFGVSVRSWLPMSGMRTFVLGDERPRGLIQVACAIAATSGACSRSAARRRGLGRRAGRPCPSWVLLRTRWRSWRRAVGSRDCWRRPGGGARARLLPPGWYQVYGREFATPAPTPPPTGWPRPATSPAHSAAATPGPSTGFYFQTAPRAVQDAEAHTSNRWELRKARRGARARVAPGGWLRRWPTRAR